MNALINSERLNAQQVIVTSDIPATLGAVEAGWNAIAVPVLLITAQLLVPVWLLLFLAVRDAAEARGPEIALAKLRGYGPWRSIVFGLSSDSPAPHRAAGRGPGRPGPSRRRSAGCCCGPAPRWRRLPFAWAAAAAATAGGLTAMLVADRSPAVGGSSGAARAGVRPTAAGCLTPSC